MSFIDHIGEHADHGHYTATVRDLSDAETWWYYNDNFVGPAGHGKLDDHKLYICFYELQVQEFMRRREFLHSCKP